MFPLILGILGGTFSALTTLMNGVSQSNQLRAQAAQMKANANMQRAQADLQKQKAETDKRAELAKRTKMTRDFLNAQAQNRTRLAAGNVDFSTGSALDVSLGNIDQYALDIGENKYNAAMKAWENLEAANQSNYQAKVYDANASHLKKTASSMLGPNLLSTALAGATGFLSTYSLAGGTLSNLWGGSASTPATAATTLARHPRPTIYD